MISVGSRDGRKGLGLGLGFGVGREMEETELEEGEACAYQNDDDSTIDPDVALSYIDEKLQDVLGHFQKDFEGGVSAENLGAKFGGYGSFLPTYQRSPVSHPRTPSKFHNHNTPRSPNNFHTEGVRHNSVIPSSVPLSVGPGPASASAASLPSLRLQSVNDSIKQESTSKFELRDVSTNHSDPKTLKVRIKVGADNLSTRKNADIYSGLGLDFSPSSSMDDSPIGSEGLSREPQDAPYESPTSILEIMTSFPVHGGLLLSPLPDDLICLTEREKLQVESRAGSRQRGNPESSIIIVNGFDSALGEGKVLGDKKVKSLEKNSSLEVKNGHGKNAPSGVDVLKKEMDIDTLACEELVSNALKLPLLSNCAVDTVKVAHKVVVKDEFVFDLVKEEPLEAISNCRSEKLNVKVCMDKKVDSHDDISVYPRKDESFKGEELGVFSKADSSVSKGKKALNPELIDPLKRSQKDTSRGKEHSSSGGKRKSKESQRHSAQHAEVPKNTKSTLATNFMSKSEVEDIKMPKNNGKATDTYRDFFGDIELEQEDNDVDPVEMPSANRLKDSEVMEKKILVSNSILEERSNGKKIDNPSMSDTYPKVGLNMGPVMGNGPQSEAAPVTAAPVVQEDWVCCDKCQKWRLLPLGTNPDSLPEKWLCSMLNWLPGMNRCNVSEEETTKALSALYHIPVPENQHGHHGGVSSAITSSDVRRINRNHVNLGPDAVASGGKKKHGSKEVLIATNQEGPPQFPNPTKNLQSSVKNRSLNGANQSPSGNKLDLQNLSKSNSRVVEKHKYKQKEENKLLEQYSDGGDTKNSKMKSKKEIDQDYFRASKKIKIDSKHHNDENWVSDHGEVAAKVVPSSSSGLSINASRDDRRKYNDNSSNMDMKCDARNSSQLPARNPKDREVQVASDDGSLHMVKYDDKDIVARKRKVNESQGHQNFVEETSENDHRTDKKARVSKSEEIETSASKGSGGTARKGRGTKDQQLEPEVQPSLAATSSSSKVSGSRKNKSNLHEVKGSPVESVSSSPLRVLNPNMSTSTRTNLSGKDDFLEAGFLQRRCSDGEDERYGTITKDETFTVAHRGSVESSVLDVPDRDVGPLKGSKAKIHTVHSPEFARSLFSIGETQYPCKPKTSDHANVSRSRKSVKGSSSRSKDKNGCSISEFDKGKIKISDSSIESVDHKTYEEKSRIGKNRVEEKFGVVAEKGERNFVGKKISDGKPTESSKRESQSQDKKQNPLLDRDGDRSSKRYVSGKTEREESGRGKSHPLPPSGRVQNDTGPRCTQIIPGSRKENGTNGLSVDASEGDDALKVSKQIKKAETQNGFHIINSKHSTPCGPKARDVDAPSPVRRDSSSQAATNALKEAKDLKHLADRLKNSGPSLESTGYYFLAAIKFLHGASLLESGNSESAKHGEMGQSKQMYSSTAKLCEFCAHEYEKFKDMATAALAYKCMEVAYMRVIYSSHTGASRDRHDLQTALQIVPSGESPSSSASDVDNLNNPAIIDKSALAKGVSSPQVAGNHVIAAQNRNSFVRLLNFAQEVNLAMEASRKSRIAFSAAKTRLEEAQRREGIDSVKRALDFNFQDMEGLLRLVRLAMEAITR